MASLHPAAAGLDYCSEIALQSAAFADAAEANLDAPVQHCPGWTVADLVHHLWQVQWFWGTIAEQRRATPPPETERPPRPDDGALLTAFREGAVRLDGILRHADPTTPVWTWAPTSQNIGFIVRHQVQEAAVHRWDAEHAAGHDVSLDVAVSVDSIEEFLTYSVSTPADPVTDQRPSLAGAFVLHATDADADWTITDSEVPATLRFERGTSPDAPVLAGTASDLLLWLYGRVELPAPDGAAPLIERFRGLSFTS